VLVFKTFLAPFIFEKREYPSVELKTLFVINSDQNSGRGIGSILLSKCEEEICKLDAKGIIVTVSEEKRDSLDFFMKKGFFVVEEQPGRYKENVTEFALFKKL